MTGGELLTATRDDFRVPSIVFTHFGRVKKNRAVTSLADYIAFTDRNTRAVYIGEITFIPSVTIEDQKSSINCW